MSSDLSKLTLSFYTRDSKTVALDLLGKILVREYQGKRLSGKIVETEAYLGVKDLASHARGGRKTSRNEAMYLEGGYVYVYVIYGMHFCMNVVTGERDDPQAVLIRALEPLENTDQMKINPDLEKELSLTSGPGKLCQT